MVNILAFTLLIFSLINRLKTFTSDLTPDILTSTICEWYPTEQRTVHGVINFTCPVNKVINIISATYGRTSSSVCGGCAACNLNCKLNATSIFMNMYNGKQVAQGTVFSALFGPDPCVGTTKYAVVQYSCIDIVQTVTICEWYPTEQRILHGVINFNCPAYKVINIISATYGRTSNSVCGGCATCKINCKLDVTSIFMRMYNGIQVAQGTVFSALFGPDPCVGTTKYAVVQYICITDYKYERFRMLY